MRLSIFIPSFASGGAERVMVRLASEMHRRGHDVEVVVAQDAGEQRYMLDEGVSVYALGTGRLMKSIRPLARYLKARRPDVLLSAMVATNCVAALARRLSGVDCRLIMSERNQPSLERFDGRANRYLIPLLRRWTYPWADGITTVSKEVRADLLNLVPLDPDRVTAIYNPAPDAPERPAEPPHRWMGRDEPVFLAIGRLDEQKDYPTLLRAFAMVRQKQAAKLVILGEGPLGPELEALAWDLGIFDDVDFHGFSPKAREFMYWADAFVMSSVREGMPNVLVEALCMGQKIVCTRCPGGPREMLGDGAFGRMVAMGDAADLAGAMASVLTDPEPDVASRQLERFDPERIYGSYESVLAGLSVRTAS